MPQTGVLFIDMKKLEKAIKKLKSGEEVKIAALGDSLTYGWMVENGYIDYLKKMIEKDYPRCSCRIFNRGVPGDTARDGLRRMDHDILRVNPDVVLIQFALNDAYMNYSPEEYQKNIDTIIIKIRDSTKSEIALVTSSAILNREENLHARRFYKKLYESAERFDLPVAAVHEYWESRISSGVVHASLVQGDGVHPTEKGYELMAEAVFSLFR